MSAIFREFATITLTSKACPPEFTVRFLVLSHNVKTQRAKRLRGASGA